MHKGSGFVGHPAIIFWLMNDYGKSSHMGNIIILDKWLSQLNAHLEATLDRETMARDYDPALTEIQQALTDTWEIYHPSFEGLETFNPEEMTFVKELRGIYHRLTLVTARSHVCDNVEYNREESHEVE